MPRPIIMLALLPALSACAVADKPTINDRDIDRAFAEASRIQNLPVTPTADLPTGSLTYDGQIGADINGELDGSILGDMTMTVGFRDNRITGDVTNINLIDGRGRPDQRLEGTLEIGGFETNGDLDALASGRVSGVDSSVDFATDINIDLQGNVRDDLINGDAVSGTAYGNAVGDKNFTIDGVFFGTER